jgi:prepilin signal peptidase PulO-like enzyme (type II secretory pathway)
MLEPFMALLLIAAPWIFGFSNVDSATTVAVVVGVLMLLIGSMTRWRPSVAKVIPLKTHFMGDLLFAAVLILSPFVLGFEDNGAATRFMIIYGVIELIATLGTRWDAREVNEDGMARTTGAAHR